MTQAGLTCTSSALITDPHLPHLVTDSAQAPPQPPAGLTVISSLGCLGSTGLLGSLVGPDGHGSPSPRPARFLLGPSLGSPIPILWVNPTLPWTIRQHCRVPCTFLKGMLYLVAKLVTRIVSDAWH